jgi:hypothetical protein
METQQYRKVRIGQAIVSRLGARFKRWVLRKAVVGLGSVATWQKALSKHNVAVCSVADAKLTLLSETCSSEFLANSASACSMTNCARKTINDRDTA